MSENRLPDYIDHIQQAASDACCFVKGLSKVDFLADKRTQSAVVMTLVIIGEAATKLMDRWARLTAHLMTNDEIHDRFSRSFLPQAC